MGSSVEPPSLGKLVLLALVSTRGAKLNYWKKVFVHIHDLFAPGRV
jgi:hypothetical protein